jgi:predicted phage-related endonuclease
MDNNTRDWLMERKGLLTASDIPSIIGHGFKSNIDLYIDKTTDDIGESEAAHMMFGHGVEGAIADFYASTTGHEVIDPGDFCITRHPDISYIGATLDREYRESIDHEAKPLELKSVHGKMGGMESWIEDPPINNQIQVNIQCAVKGAANGRLVGLFPGYHMAISEVEFNAEFFKHLEIEIDKFWNYHVKKRIPPEPIPHREALRSVKRLFPQEDGSTKEMPQGSIVLANEMEDLNRGITRDKKRVEEIKTKLIFDMGASTFGRLPDGTFLTNKTQKRKETIQAASSSRVLRRTKILN